MSDICDRASEHEEELRADALQAQRRRAGSDTKKRLQDSARECRVCGEPIPLARRRAALGVKTCVECQTDLERALNGRSR